MVYFILGGSNFENPPYRNLLDTEGVDSIRGILGKVGNPIFNDQAATSSVGEEHTFRAEYICLHL